ncbi:putative secreted protein (Por secretion system target) [Spirosoma oryzae]|uniref:Putative secreted protein (Por secretion system target) n=1 Tax=Spirosoma oryzae TaxID=1469603 RepID=A0A2T0TMX4_9BACT|nr:M12 family metallo-peptidase [Spirosoma oryzae]PRY47007.1 putative secreted protein (Por secretion system target) [Spirosoma oryzae]
MRQLSTLVCICLCFGVWIAPATAQTVPFCGVNDQVLPDSVIRLMARLPQLRAGQQARRAAGEQRVCRIAVEIDSDTYLAYAKDTNQIRSYVLAQIGQVSTIFEREINTRLTVVSIHIWKDTEPDPYRGETNPATLFSRLQTVWPQLPTRITSDKRVYLLTKQTSTTVLGVGGGDYVVSRLDIPTIAHELGHAFDSPHTHNCAWPGGPIDYCSNIEGSCYTESLENVRGTLMSYCEIRQQSFHPLCQTLMTNYAITNLPVLNTPAQAPLLPAQLTLTNTPFLYWDGQPTANRYDIDVSQTADFARKQISDTTAQNGYSLPQLVPGQAYFVRVRSVNRLGASDWSGVCQLQLAGSTADVPVLLSPTNDQTMVPYSDNKRFTVRPVAGAVAYQLQLAQDNDLAFATPLATTTGSTPALSLTDYNSGALRWRVRALFSNRTGPWSTPGRFFGNPPSYRFFRSVDEVAPLTFPYLYVPAIQSATVRVVVSTDPQFTKPIYAKTFRDATLYTDILQNLTPFTTYYVRTEEINNRYDYPAGTLAGTTSSFRTGDESISSAWTFINGGTRADWSQGFLFGSPKAGNGAMWAINDNGLARLAEDSIRTFSRQSTRGKIGTQRARISTDDDGAIWLMNQISANVFKNKIPVPYFQLGKLDEATGTLSNRVTFTYSGTDGLMGFDARQRLFFTGYGVYRLSGDSLTTLYKLPAGASLTRWATRAGLLWLIQADYANTAVPTSLIRINTTTGVTTLFNMTNTPALDKYLNLLVVDGHGTVWVSHSGGTTATAPLVRFDGQTWTSFPRSSTMPVSSPIDMTVDAADNLLVNDYSTPYTIYRYDGTAWRQVTKVTPGALQSINVDSRGAIWLSGQFQLTRFNPCSDLKAPMLTVDKPTVEAGEIITLQAAGCQDVLWSWAAGADTVSNRLIRYSNLHAIKPDANTIYQASCYRDGCVGKAASLGVTVLPVLALTASSPRSYCPGDSVGLYLTQQGQFAAGNQISLKLTGQAQLIDLTTRQNGTILTTTLPASLAAGTYKLFAQSTQPVVRTRDSLQVTLVALPTAEFSTDKRSFPVGDSSRVSVNLTGAAPWSVLDAANRPLTIQTSPYTFYVKATQPANFTLTLKDLRDANCARGIVKNELTISSLVLADEPVASSHMTVFPNPVARQVAIDSDVPIAELSLRDMQGREVAHQSVTGRHTRFDWSLPDLPVGQYTLLVMTTDGNRTHWKLIRH